MYRKITVQEIPIAKPASDSQRQVRLLKTEQWVHTYIIQIFVKVTHSRQNGSHTSFRYSYSSLIHDRRTTGHTLIIHNWITHSWQNYKRCTQNTDHPSHTNHSYSDHLLVTELQDTRITYRSPKTSLVTLYNQKSRQNTGHMNIIHRSLTQNMGRIRQNMGHIHISYIQNTKGKTWVTLAHTPFISTGHWGQVTYTLSMHRPLKTGAWVTYVTPGRTQVTYTFIQRSFQTEHGSHNRLLQTEYHSHTHCSCACHSRQKWVKKFTQAASFTHFRYIKDFIHFTYTQLHTLCKYPAVIQTLYIQMVSYK